MAAKIEIEALRGFESFFRVIVLEINKNGTYSEIESPLILPYFVVDQRETFRGFLLSKTKITEVFAIPENKNIPLRSAIALNTPYPLQQFFQHSLYALNMFSSLPAFYIVFTENGDRLIGNVLYKPVVSGSDSRPMVFFDEKENICAFNMPFFELFDGVTKTPPNLFSKNLATILGETPSQITNRLFLEQEEMPLFTRETNLLAAREFTNWDTAPVLHNNTDSLIFVTCKREINISDNCVKLRIKYNSGNNAPPIFMFGAESPSPVSGYAPDYRGFSIGPDTGNTSLLLKKSGWLILSVPYVSLSRPFHDAEITLSGKRVSCRIDGADVLQCDLFETHWVQKCHFHVAARPGYTIDISHFTISEGKRKIPSPSATSLIQFRHLPNRFFAFAYIPRIFVSSTTTDIRGIELHEVTSLQEEILSSRERITQLKRNQEKNNMEVRFIGESPSIRKMLDYALPLARSELTILLSGQTGSGKEVLARYIHSHSQRFDKPFIKMDCSTIPDSLFESIVFGHVKGSFTGATHDTTGIIESANQGTVFIDEIQNLSLSSQTKLLRILEERTIHKIGSNEFQKVDVRFIAGTNQNLQQKIRNGSFREDLYYRINLAQIDIPSLADRKEDIPELSLNFVRLYNAEMAAKIEAPSIKCIRILDNYNWPGNVRELKNVIYHACIFSEKNELVPEVVSRLIADKENVESRSAGSYKRETNEYEQRVRCALDKTKGNAAKAAKVLGISRNSFYYTMRKYSIDIEKYRTRFI